MKVIETMGGIDVLTRDLADMPNGTSFVTHFGERTINPREYPISGDEIARIRSEAGESDGPDCGA